MHDDRLDINDERGHVGMYTESGDDIQNLKSKNQMYLQAYYT